MIAFCLDGSTDGGASLRHAQRMRECCALLGNGGIAADDLHKWADVMDCSYRDQPLATLNAEPRGLTTEQT